MIDFSQPPIIAAIIAAAVAALISICVTVANQYSLGSLHRERLELDRDLLLKKFELDKELAERRFEYEREQVVKKRRFEVAESILADIYKFRDLMQYVRFSPNLGTEGESRTINEAENEELRKLRNSYFVPLERLNQNRNVIADFMSKEFIAYTYLGKEARDAFKLFSDSVMKVRIAASALIETANQPETAQKTHDDYRKDLLSNYAQFEDRNDEIADDIEKGVSIIEQKCLPLIESV